MSILLDATGRDYLSYSGIDSLLSCGEKFRLERVVGVKQQPAWYLAGGTAVHTATEVYDSTDDIDAALAAFYTSMDQAINSHTDEEWRAGGRKTKDYPGGEDGAWWMHNGPTMVRRYAAWRIGNPHLQLFVPEGVEGTVEVPVDFELTGVPVKGFIDRVFVNHDGQVVIVDIKTGSRVPASSLQLAVYRLGLEKVYGFSATFGGYYMARTSALEFVPLERYTESMISRMFRNARRMIEVEAYTPHLSFLCGSCSVNRQCYAYNPDATDHLPDFDSDMTNKE